MAVRTVYEVQQAVRGYHAEHGVRPTCKDFRTFDRWLRLNGSSIKILCDDMNLPERDRGRGRRHDGRTLEQTEEEVRAFYQKHGYRPTSRDLSTLDSWLRNHHNTGISDVCHKLGIPGGKKKRTLESATQEIRDYHTEHGRRPRRADMSAVDEYLRQYHGSSVSRVGDDLGYRKLKQAFTEEEIRARVVAFRETHNRRPTAKDLPNENQWLHRNMETSISQYCNSLGYAALDRKGVRAARLRQNFYWNLHKDVFSIREQGKVIAHARFVSLENVRFNVGKMGALKVVKTGVKNVHASISGYPCDMPESVVGWTRVYYNPTRGPYFTDEKGRACMFAGAVVGYEVSGKPQIHATGIEYFTGVEPLEMK